MFNSMRYEDEKDHMIRNDSAFSNCFKKQDELDMKVDFLISSYCLNILIKNDLDEFKKGTSTLTFKETVDQIKIKQDKFIEDLSHDMDHNQGNLLRGIVKKIVRSGGHFNFFSCYLLSNTLKWL